jgi:hypothetical protein
MAKLPEKKVIVSVRKATSQGSGHGVAMSTMNKDQKRSFKKYRGQGK